MRSFAYDPAKSFRGWLRTLAHHAWADFVEGRQRPERGSGAEVKRPDLADQTMPAPAQAMQPRNPRRSRQLFEKHGLRHSVDLPGMVAERLKPPVRRLPAIEARRGIDFHPPVHTISGTPNGVARLGVALEAADERR